MTKRKNTADILKPSKPKRTYKKKVKSPAVVVQKPLDNIKENLVVQAPLDKDSPKAEKKVYVKKSLLDRILDWFLN